MKQNNDTRITPQMAANERLKLAAFFRPMDCRRLKIITPHVFFIERLKRWPWAKELVWRHLEWEFAQLTKREVRDHQVKGSQP